jgi:hypothetical protein
MDFNSYVTITFQLLQGKPETSGNPIGNKRPPFNPPWRAFFFDNVARPATQIGAMFGGMDTHKTTLERAFDIARSGECIDLSDLVKRLNHEGYQTKQIEGAPGRPA